MEYRGEHVVGNHEFWAAVKHVASPMARSMAGDDHRVLRTAGHPASDHCARHSIRYRVMRRMFDRASCAIATVDRELTCGAMLHSYAHCACRRGSCWRCTACGGKRRSAATKSRAGRLVGHGSMQIVSSGPPILTSCCGTRSKLNRTTGPTAKQKFARQQDPGRSANSGGGGRLAPCPEPETRPIRAELQGPACGVVWSSASYGLRVDTALPGLAWIALTHLGTGT